MNNIIKPAFHHATIKTNRLQEMIDWYGLVTGATVQFQNNEAAWTTNDASNHRVAFLASPGIESDPDKIMHSGMHHTGFEYDSFEDLMQTYARLRDEGIMPAFSLDHGITTSIYYRDPDGNYVELQSDNFGDWKLSSEWIRTSPDFAANPIGTFFDPEKVYQAFKGGKTIEVLHPAMRAGDFLPNPVPDIGVPPI